MRTFGIVVAIIGIIFVCVGFYKKGVYEEPSNRNAFEGKNCYVGGDAYNYIINGNYFAGYSALGGSLIIVGGVLFAAGAICEELEATRRNCLGGAMGTVITAMAEEAEKKKILANGGWKCPDCGKLHHSYETSCSCGKSKSDI